MWNGGERVFAAPPYEAQFKKYKYPADGYPEIQMYYRYGGSFIGTMCETNRYIKAYQNAPSPFCGKPVDLVGR